jgi:excisionase family DNA binding protein
MEMVMASRKKKKAPELPPLDINQRFSVPEAAKYLRVSVATVNVYIAQNRIQTIKDGGRRFVPGSEIARKSALPPDPQGKIGAAG